MEPTSMDNGIKTWQWVVTIIVIITLIIIGIFIFGSKKAVTPDLSEQTTETPVTITNPNRVIIQDQFPGNVVYISTVSLAQPGWVVIRKDNAGQPGDIIGSMYFEAGTGPGKITLTK
ncbi:MAG: hypothetical protein NTZ38_01950, partial [Candidatus Taylorbacteria bacterium]|nr:hypothetical protein [Candidatus Taylorbacteria bacterium]